MLMNSHQVPAPSQPCRRPSRAAPRGAARRAPTRQASSGDAEQLQRPGAGLDEGERLCSAPSSGDQQLEPRPAAPARAGAASSAPSAAVGAGLSAARVTLNQRTAPPRASITVKTQAADVDRLAAPRHAAELVRDQAADGVELVGRQRDAEAPR